jgi:hypothetical protein
LGAKLQLGNRNVTDGLPTVSKAERCSQAGSQAGAWEPEERQRRLGVSDYYFSHRKSKMSDKFLLIDYENIQKVNLSDVPDNILVRIFVGQSQKSIPFELVQQAQRFGHCIEWIKIEGQGSNALDFHIAFYIGKLLTEHKRASFIILSKDKGFDPLIKHINNLKGNCRRINSLFELSTVTGNHSKDQNLKRTIECLSKIEKSKRPRKRITLSQYVSNIFQKKLEDSEIDKIIDYLFIEKLVSETGGKLSYSF